MKKCPVCGSRCFDDMEVCFGCMHRFNDEESPKAESGAGLRLPVQTAQGQGSIAFEFAKGSKASGAAQHPTAISTPSHEVRIPRGRPVEQEATGSLLGRQSLSGVGTTSAGDSDGSRCACPAVASMARQDVNTKAETSSGVGRVKPAEELQPFEIEVDEPDDTPLPPAASGNPDVFPASSDDALRSANAPVGSEPSPKATSGVGERCSSGRSSDKEGYPRHHAASEEQKSSMERQPQPKAIEGMVAGLMNGYRLVLTLEKAGA